MDGPLIAGLALFLGGLATTGLAIWQMRQPDDNKLWAISNSFEGWIYGIGGVIAAIIGAVVLLDYLG